MTIKLVVNGAAGRMGRQVIGVATASSDVEVVGGVVRPDSPIVGVDVGVQAGVQQLGVLLTADPDTALEGTDVALDVSVAGASVGFAQRAAVHGIPTVVATTGLASSQLAALEELSTRVAILIAPNLSVGINVLAEVLPAIVRALGSDYDIEVVEAHHRHKKDAPSGTAIRLAEAIASALDRPLAELERYGRHGLAPRVAGEIGMHALRMGGNPGEHHVYFASEGEEIEISHRALSRETFARGAVRAVRYLAGKPPGLYSMSDVLR
jgi:4-hydroxy-tetrahydrodipicolinate reductase